MFGWLLRTLHFYLFVPLRLRLLVNLTSGEAVHTKDVGSIPVFLHGLRIMSIRKETRFNMVLIANGLIRTSWNKSSGRFRSLYGVCKRIAADHSSHSHRPLGIRRAMMQPRSIVTRERLVGTNGIYKNRRPGPPNSTLRASFSSSVVRNFVAFFASTRVQIQRNDSRRLVQDLLIRPKSLICNGPMKTCSVAKRLTILIPSPSAAQYKYILVYASRFTGTKEHIYHT